VQRTFEFNTKDNEKVKEDVGADVKDNYVKYHLKDRDSEVWVIEDFNRVCSSNSLTMLHCLAAVTLSLCCSFGHQLGRCQDYLPR